MGWEEGWRARNDGRGVNAVLLIRVVQELILSLRSAQAGGGGEHGAQRTEAELRDLDTMDVLAAFEWGDEFRAMLAACDRGTSLFNLLVPLVMSFLLFPYELLKTLALRYVSK